MAARLDVLRVPYFLDEKNVRLGDSLTETLGAGIPDCSHLLVLISAGSRKSQWVPYEIGFARGHRLTIVPFSTHPAENPLPFISDLKYTLTIDQLEEYLKGLLAAKPQGKTHFEAISKPDDDARALADRLGHKEAVIESVIEIWADHSLESM